MLLFFLFLLGIPLQGRLNYLHYLLQKNQITFELLDLKILNYIWDKVLKNRPSKSCGNQPLKILLMVHSGILYPIFTEFYKNNQAPKQLLKIVCPGQTFTNGSGFSSIEASGSGTI